MTCRPKRWLWGVLPLAVIIAFASLGVQKQIERDLSERASLALQDAGYYWALSTFQARDATIEGISFSGSERDSALDLLQNLWGVRTVTDGIRVIASPDTYSWLANKKDKRVQLRGYVPTEEDRLAIIGFVKAALPDYEVDDKMVLAGGSPPRQVWLGSVSYALVQLAQLRVGSVHLDGTALTLNGEAQTTAAFRALNTSLAGQLPSGLEIKSAQVRPPTVKPYDWRVKYNGSTISFAGYVPDEKTHQQVLERTRNLFPGVKIEDTMELGSGAPQSWSWAISASLTQLNRLESGRAKLKDTVLEFEGVASDELTAKQVTSSIRNSLPGTYRSNEKITFKEQGGGGQTPKN